MDNIIDYYKVLNVSYYATFEEIKNAYRIRVKETHPDSESGHAESFKLVKEAYDVLSNEEKRKRYNEFLFNYTKVNTPVSNNIKNDVPPVKNNHYKKSKLRIQKPLTILSYALNIALIGLIIWGYSELGDQKNKVIEVQDNVENSEESLSDLKEEYETLNDKYISLETQYNDYLEQREAEDVNRQESSEAEVSTENTDSFNSEGAFTQGSSKEHVKNVMGAPSGLHRLPSGREIWSYGLASVTFTKEGVVEGWSDYNGDVLKVQ